MPCSISLRAAALTAAFLALSLPAPGAAAPARGLDGPCTLVPSAPRAPNPALDVLDRLAALPGVVSVAEQPVTRPGLEGARFFLLELDQPADHCDPASPRFTQRASLLWRGEDRPTVLVLSGYFGSVRQFQAEPTALLGANQIYVEHRFFEPSAPEPLDWRWLDIFQAASDDHRIVEALRTLLHGRWLNTGSSKGGMTAVYHRAYYPQDVDATLAYVAPLSYGTYDERYVGFVDTAGDDPACRQALRDYQVALLEREEEVKPLMVEEAGWYGETFDLLGVDTAWEWAVVETPYYFWQYGAATCADVPAPDADAWTLYGFMQWVTAPVWSYGDSSLLAFAPYYYQAATQLGGPGYATAHLEQWLTIPFGDRPENYPPYGVEKTFDAERMAAVQAWVLDAGRRLLFVYGANDPWTAGAFEVAPANEQLRYIVAGGNHGTILSDLPEAEFLQATGMLERWMGTDPSQPGWRLGLREREGESFDRMLERVPGP